MKKELQVTADFKKLPLLPLFLCLFLILTSCSEGAKAQQQKALEAAAMERYRTQPHRFEIRSCKLYYNEQQVVLDSLETFERIFGDNAQQVSFWQRYYTDKPVEVYLKVCHDGEKPRPCIERLNILMSHKQEYDMRDEFDSLQSLRPVLKGYILFDSVLVDANTRIEDLNQQLEEKGKYTLGTSWGNQASQAIRYDGTACRPAPNCKEPCLSVVKLYYYEDYITKEPTTIQTFRYEY